jgi:hypothetical protein
MGRTWIIFQTGWVACLLFVWPRAEQFITEGLHVAHPVLQK